MFRAVPREHQREEERWKRDQVIETVERNERKNVNCVTAAADITIRNAIHNFLLARAPSTGRKHLRDREKWAFGPNHLVTAAPGLGYFWAELAIRKRQQTRLHFTDPRSRNADEICLQIPTYPLIVRRAQPLIASRSALSGASLSSFCDATESRGKARMAEIFLLQQLHKRTFVGNEFKKTFIYIVIGQRNISRSFLLSLDIVESEKIKFNENL